jgi:diacylglycerol kinase
MRKVVQSFKWAIKGVRCVWREEKMFRIEILCVGFAIGAGFFVGFNMFEWAVFVVGITMVLSAEITNTAIEDLCNKVEPKPDPFVGKIKDMMAGFVLVVSAGTLIIGMLLFIPHISFFGK